MNKEQKKAKFLELLRQRFQDGGASEKELQGLSNKFDEVLAALKDTVSNQFITKVPPEVAISNLQVEVNKVLELNTATSKEFNDQLTALYKQIYKSRELQETISKWYQDPSVSVKGEVTSVIKGPVNVTKDDSLIVSALAALFGSLIGALTKLAGRTVRIMGIPEHYTTPQFVMLVDPANGRPVRPDEIGKAPIPGGLGGTAIAASGGPTHVGSRGADAFNDGLKTITTAGTAVQLADDTECFQVTIQAHPDNAGDVVVGGASVVAASAGRRGLSLYGSQWATFKVSNLNQIWLDSTESGDKVNYFYER